MPEPMTPEQLAAIRARCEAATAGMWTPSTLGRTIRLVDGDNNDIALFGTVDNEQNRANAWFAAHARSDVPALIAEVERLQAQLAARDRELAAAEAFVQAARYLRAGIVTDPQFERGDDLVGWLYTHKDAYERVVEFDHASDLFDAAKGAERD